MDKPKLLTEDQLAEIRAGVKEGIRGPVVTKWLEWMIADHDERVRLERECRSPDRLRNRYGRRRDATPSTD